MAGLRSSRLVHVNEDWEIARGFLGEPCPRVFVLVRVPDNTVRMGCVVLLHPIVFPTHYEFLHMVCRDAHVSCFPESEQPCPCDGRREAGVPVTPEAVVGVPAILHFFKYPWTEKKYRFPLSSTLIMCLDDHGNIVHDSPIVLIVECIVESS